jgi:hypothetical protein
MNKPDSLTPAELSSHTSCCHSVFHIILQVEEKESFFFLTLVGLYDFAMGLSLEIACFNEESAVNAADGGADRIE